MEIVNFDQVFDLEVLVEKIVLELLSGGVVGMPSDAGYVLLVSANAFEKVERIRKALNYDDPAVFLVESKNMIPDLIEMGDDVVNELIEEYIPGKIIIEANGVGLFESNLVRVRMIDSNLFQKISERFDGQILCFEAGRTGGESIYSNEQFCSMYNEFDLVSLFIDDGVLNLDRLPDIVKVNDNQISFIREGDLVSLLISQFSLKS